MSEKFMHRIKLLIIIALIALSSAGCGGGGGSDAVDPATLVATLATGKLSTDGAGNQDILFASVGGSGVSGGWIEDVNGNKIAGSDLAMENTTSRYEVLMQRGEGGFTAGTYVLKYFVNGEALTYKRENLQWTTAAQFQTAPDPLNWNAINRLLTVSYNPVNGANVRYFLRIYSAVTGSLYRETQPTNGFMITETISFPGEYRVVLNAEVLENGLVVSTAKHNFTTVIQASVRVP